jgi:small-conductance mechanosensitive channel
MLDEVIVRLPFDADHVFAQELCLQAAREAVQETIGETDEEPFFRAEFLAWGVLLRVRFKTIPARRQEVSSHVTERIWQAFRSHPSRVRFGVPVEGINVDPSADAPPPSGGTEATP